jgi:hypothetical protein
MSDERLGERAATIGIIGRVGEDAVDPRIRLFAAVEEVASGGDDAKASGPSPRRRAGPAQARLPTQDARNRRMSAITATAHAGVG